jgi:hypothetical protein
MRLALAASRAAMQTLPSHHMRAALLARCAGAPLRAPLAPAAPAPPRAGRRLATFSRAALDVATEAGAAAAAGGGGAGGPLAAKGAAAVSAPRARRTFKPRITVRELLVRRVLLGAAGGAR